MSGIIPGSGEQTIHALRSKTRRETCPIDWWACLDSNQEPDRYERPALTIELQARQASRRRHATVPHPLTMALCAGQSLRSASPSLRSIPRTQIRRADAVLRSRGAGRPRFASVRASGLPDSRTTFPALVSERACGTPGADAPAASHALFLDRAHECSHHSHTGTPGVPHAMVLTAYVVAPRQPIRFSLPS